MDVFITTTKDITSTNDGAVSLNSSMAEFAIQLPYQLDEDEWRTSQYGSEKLSSVQFLQ